MLVCVGISIAFIASLVMKFGGGLLGGVRSVGVELCMVFFLLVLGRFARLGGGMEFVLGHSPSEVGMLTPSEGFFNGIFSGGVDCTGIIPGMFALVARWCVHGSKHICVGAVGVDDVWVVCAVVDGTWSAVSPNIFANFGRLTHGTLGMFDFIFCFSVLHG